MVLTPISEVRAEIDSNAENVFIVAHGGIQEGNVILQGEMIRWHKGLIEGFDIKHDGVLTPLSEFGPGLRSDHIFGCYISPRIRKQKLEAYVGKYSMKDTYTALYDAFKTRLEKYLSPSPTQNCTKDISIYEGERTEAGMGTEEVLRLHPVVGPESNYTGKQNEN